VGSQYVGELLRAFTNYGDDIAIEYSGQEISYAALGRRVASAVGILADLNVRPGDVAFYVGPNTPEAIVFRLAAHLAGVVHTSLTTGANPMTILCSEIADHAGARLVVSDDLAVADLPGTTVISTEDYKRALDKGRSRQNVLRDLSGEDDICRISYTSGSSGAPKGVFSSYRATGARRAWWNDRQLPKRMTLLVVSRLDSTVGPTVIEHLVRGDKIKLLKSDDPSEIEDAVDPNLTSVVLPPVPFGRLVERFLGTGRDVPRFRSITYGTAPIHPRMISNALSLFGPILRQVYGMTEAPGISVLSEADHGAIYDGARTELASSVGRPRRGVEVEVRDGDRALPQGEIGEIWIRTPTMMTGYWRDVSGTQSTIVNGWLRTKDIGRIGHLNGGYLELLDRARDVVMVNGDNRYTRPIEEALGAAPGVRFASVVAVRDPIVGEVPIAFIELAGGWAERVFERDLRAWGEGSLEPIDRPRRYVLLDQLPRNRRGKVDKVELRKQAEALWED